MMDELLKQYGVEYDDLDSDERETLTVMVQAAQERTLTVEKVKQMIDRMISSVQLEVSKHDLSDKEDLYLKARLRNLTLIAAFLESPEQAKAHLHKMLSNLAHAEG